MINVSETVPAIEDALGIKVVKREQHVTFRQTLALTNKDKVGAALAYLQDRFHAAKVSGRVLCVHMSQGGIMSVTTEQVAHIRIGSQLEELTDQAFARDSLDIKADVG